MVCTTSSPVKAVMRLAAILIAILIFSAWAAPLLFHVLPFEYEPILNRLITVLTLAAVYVLYVRGRAKEVLLVGLSGTARMRWFVSGVLFGIFTLVFILFLEMLSGIRYWNINFSKYGPLVYFTKALATGITVGVFEEWFFRGFLLKSFHRALSMGWSIFWVNVFYAASHFIMVGNLQAGARASFINSLKLIAGVYARHPEPITVVMGFVGLFIFGYFLTQVFLKTGSLYLSMGWHTGLVTALKYHSRLVGPLDTKWNWFWGDRHYYNGVVGWLCLLFCGFLLLKILGQISWPKTKLNLSLKGKP